ncbi:MAG: tetratricopeptide repeat protein [Verrucomicrobia subdivision 3 bacterium]|nr:tetratricopeptide repeat protein [Limisphaerales bacterium]
MSGPDSPTLTPLQLGQRCREHGELAQAEAHLRSALEAEPALLPAHLELGLVQQMHEDWPAARECFEAAHALDASNPQILNAIGYCWQREGQFRKAITPWRQAVKLDANYAQVWQNLALAHEHLNELAEAIECHQQAVALQPEDANAHRLLGMAQLDFGLHDAARKCNARALELAPEDPEAHWQRFFLRALEGDFPDAWVDYEWRFKLPGRTTPDVAFEIPRWDGQPAHEGTLLLHAEQGFGDTLQMLRYLPRIAMRVRRVQLCAPRPLLPLLENVPSLNEVFAHVPQTPTADFHLPLMSLPGEFGDSLETFPNETPYLKAPAGHPVLPPRNGSRPRVGLAWRGSGSQPLDRRSLPDTALAVLREAEVDWFSLQPEGDAPEGFTDLSAQLTDFGATARVMDELDLVVSVDTAAAHLAGALGRPTWVLLSFAPDWRWLWTGDSSPWYPEARLFRQEQNEDWRPLIRRVLRALQELKA